MKANENEKKKTAGCLAEIWTWPTQLPPAQKVRQQTTLIITKYFSLPFTLFEPNVELYLSQIQEYTFKEK